MDQLADGMPKVKVLRACECGITGEKLGRFSEVVRDLEQPVSYTDNLLLVVYKLHFITLLW